jgi:WD40 repeat protein
MPHIEARRLGATTSHLRIEDDPADIVEVEAAAFTPDGRLAVADEEGMVWLYNTAGERLTPIGSGSVAVEPDSDWEARTLTWTAQYRQLTSLVIQRTGPRPLVHPESLVSWLVVMDAENLRPVRSWRISSHSSRTVHSLSWATHADVYALLNDRRQPEIRRQSDNGITVTIPPASDPQRLDRVKCLDLSTNATHLATAATCAYVQVWPMHEGILGEPLRIAHPRRAHPVPSGSEDYVWCEDIVWSPDGARLAWSDRLGGVWWWQVEDEPMARSLDFPYYEGEGDFSRWFRAVSALAWSWDSQWLLGVDNSGFVRCWQPGTASGYATLHRMTGRAWRPAWGPDGLIAVPGDTGVVNLFSLR